MTISINNAIAGKRILNRLNEERATLKTLVPEGHVASMRKILIKQHGLGRSRRRRSKRRMTKKMH